MRVQAFLAELSVEGFHNRVVGRIAATAEVHFYLIGVRPQIRLATGEL